VVVFNMPSLDDEMDERTLLRKADDIQRQAYEEGFSSGEKAGLAHGEQKAEVLLERLEGIIKELEEFRGSLADRLESQVVDLSTAIARKIIIDEVRTKPEIITTMVREALLKLQRTGTITIKINPSLHEIFKSKKPALLDVHPDIVFDVNSGVPVTAPLVISEIEEVVIDIDSLLANVVEEMKKGNE
jgi:flagellar assembly protein FliH